MTDRPMTAEIRQGDALALLRDLPTGSVDAVITDPPYSSGGWTRGDRMADTVSKYVTSSAQGEAVDFAGDNRDQRGYAYWCGLWLGECLRVVKSGGICVLFSDWRQLPVTSDALQAGGFIWRGVVPWAKSFGARGARPMAGRFASQCEYAVWGSKGAMPLRIYEDACLPGFYQANAPREREHITQKPLEIMREMVRICPKGGTVLDPFAGSGTTGVAAVLEGRQFIGFELSEHYAKVARNRVQTAVQGYRDDGAQMVLGVEDGAA